MDGLQTSSSVIHPYQQFIAFDGARPQVMIVDDDPDAWKPELRGKIGRFDLGLAGERKGLVTGAILDAEIAWENTPHYCDLQLQAGLLQHLPVSAWTLKPDGTPDFVNQVWLEFAGQTLDFVRSHPEAWMTAVHPEDREAAMKAFWERSSLGTGVCDRNPVSPRSGRDLSLAPPASRALARCEGTSHQIRRYNDRHRRPEAYRRSFTSSAGGSCTHQSGDNHGRVSGIPGS